MSTALLPGLDENLIAKLREDGLRREARARTKAVIAAVVQAKSLSEEYEIGFQAAFEHFRRAVADYQPSNGSELAIMVRDEINANVFRAVKDGLCTLAVFRLNAPDEEQDDTTGKHRV